MHTKMHTHTPEHMHPHTSQPVLYLTQPLLSRNNVSVKGAAEIIHVLSEAVLNLVSLTITMATGEIRGSGGELGE